MSPVHRQHIAEYHPRGGGERVLEKQPRGRGAVSDLRGGRWGRPPKAVGRQPEGGSVQACIIINEEKINNFSFYIQKIYI